MSFQEELRRNKDRLKAVETTVTTATGKKYIENTRDPVAVQKTLPDAVGFCVDYSPDKVVGVAAEGLLVGSQDVAYDKTLLQSLGVTHILNVGYQLQNAFPQDFQYMRVDMYDSEEQCLLDAYHKCAAFLEEGMQSGKVMVHCNAGCSRSVSIALCHVLHKEVGVGLSEALERLRRTRPAAKPNDSFMKQLKDVEVKLSVQPQD